jgi:hypothetical protein
MLVRLGDNGGLLGQGRRQLTKYAGGADQEQCMPASVYEARKIDRRSLLYSVRKAIGKRKPVQQLSSWPPPPIGQWKVANVWRKARSPEPWVIHDENIHLVCFQEDGPSTVANDMSHGVQRGGTAVAAEIEEERHAWRADR